MLLVQALTVYSLGLFYIKNQCHKHLSRLIKQYFHLHHYFSVLYFLLFSTTFKVPLLFYFFHTLKFRDCVFLLHIPFHILKAHLTLSIWMTSVACFNNECSSFWCNVWFRQFPKIMLIGQNWILWTAVVTKI